MNKKLKTLISVPTSKKFFKVSISILMSALILLLSLTPFLPKFSYTPFKAFAVEIIPSKTYKITYDLPHLSKGITAKQREKAENNLSKTFGIPLSSLKQNEYLSKPLVHITYIPFLKKYEGFVKIGNIVSKFEKIKVIQKGTQTATKSNSDSDNQSGIFLTGYFTLNNKPLRANIFIMNNGSLLQYSSMTIQDQNDNVLAMFTYGKSFTKENNGQNPIHRTSINVTPDKKSALSFGNAKMKTRSYSVKYAYINDPLGDGYSYYEPEIRTDVMSDNPFPTSNGSDQDCAIRTWTFQNRIAEAYRGFYEHHYGSGWANVGIYKITNKYALHYSAKADTANGYPEESDFTYNSFPVSFTFYNLISVDYTIQVPSGRESNWSYSYDSYYGGSSTYRNIADYYIKTSYPYSGDTFNYDWNQSIQWKEGDYSYSYQETPDSSFKGYFTNIDFFNHANWSAYFGDFYTSAYYVIQAGSNALYDVYYIAVSNNLYDVRLDQ